MERMNKPVLLDYLIAIPVIVLYWWHGFTTDRCPKSPDKRHSLTVIRQGKAGCIYCGKVPDRVAPGVDGKDR